MIGDTQDMLGRIKSVLPIGWFADTTPILDALLTGLATAWSSLYTLSRYVQSQTRIGSASGIFLDIAAADFFGAGLRRRAGEADRAYSSRIKANLLTPRATRDSLVQALTQLTGRAPKIFEPLNATDTGGYNINIGYNTIGGYGSRSLPYQFFVTAYRPDSTPVSNAGGYNKGPGGYNETPMFYADMSLFPGTVSDAEIYTAAAAVLPTSSVAWIQILS